MESNKKIFPAKNISDILYQMKTVQNLKIIGGASYLKEFPDSALTIRNIAELSQINRHERYIDFGPAVTLNRILSLGQKRIPLFLYEAIESIGNHFSRNIATLGGNICAKNPRLTLFAPLLAMGAGLRFRNQDGFINIPFSKFESIPEGYILTNIRIPDDDWDVAIFRRVGPRHEITEESASFCFLAKTDKDILIDLRIAFAGPMVFASRDIENKLLGIRLPISDSTIEDFLLNAANYFDECTKELNYNPILRQQFLNITQYSLNQLT